MTKSGIKCYYSCVEKEKVARRTMIDYTKRGLENFGVVVYGQWRIMW